MSLRRSNSNFMKLSRAFHQAFTVAREVALMITRILSRLFLLTFATCVLATSPDQDETRINRIENGLLPGVLIKGSPRPKMSIAERMRHYKVPGLSVALINNGAIEWTRGY